MADDLRAARRTSISVRCLNPRSKLSLGTGTVIVDGERVGFTIAGRDRVFRVRSGLHTVEVRYGMARSNPVDLRVADGEQVGLAFTLVCGWQPKLGFVTFVACYLALLPVVTGFAYLARGPWATWAPALLNMTTFTQSMLPWVYYVSPALSSWTMLAVLFTVVWLASLPVVLLRQGTSLGELVGQVLAGGEIVLMRDDRPATPSPIDLLVSDPGPMPEDHLSLKAAMKARSTLRVVQRPAPPDGPAD